MNERAIFIAALQEQDAAKRAAYVEIACGSDQGLRDRVEKLLKAHIAAGAALDTVDLAKPTADFQPTIDMLGAHVGPYKILQEIGEGGFGIVYMAEQVEPVRRKVALKIIKPGMDSKEVIARFESERQALALMDHPNIARVLDAGTTSAGRPYFVMELVKGVPITDFCDKNHLSAQDRLLLFISVCQAVQHAHHKGIIHRDIKPSNIMVTLHDGKPVAKVIDFGVAKATNQHLTEKTLFTSYGQMIGTPAYMSPEQAEMSGLDVDTRSDIYSLGVLLYELLTGTTPFDSQRLRTAGLTEMQRIIRDEEPPRPSTRITGLGDSAQVICSSRQSDPRQLRKLLSGDLDVIVMKTLEKDRNRRYETATALAADVERFLKGDAVQARAPSALYRFRKFARRNRVALCMVAVIAGALLAGTVVSVWQAIRATAAEGQALAERDAKERALQAEAEQRRQAQAQAVRAAAAEIEATKARDKALAEKRRADEEAAIARAVNNFLRKDLLGQADVENQTGGEPNPNVTVRELLDLTAKAIDGKFPGQDQTEAAIRLTLGNAYLALGEHAQAQTHLERALALRRDKLGPSHPDTLESMNDLGALYRDSARDDEAEQLFKQALAGRRDRLGTDHPDTLDTMNNLAALWHHRGRYQDAEALYKQALEGFRSRLGTDAPLTLDVLTNLGILYWDQRRFDEAEKFLREAFERNRAKLGGQHPATLRGMTNLAGVWMDQGRLDDAEPLLKQALAGDRARLGPEHPATLATLEALGRLYNRHERYAEAEPLLREAVTGVRKKLGSNHPRTQLYVSALANTYAGLQKPALAEPLLRELASSARAKWGPNSSGHAAQLSRLALNLLEQDRFGDAEPVARECLTIREKKEPDTWNVFHTRSLLGGALLGQKKYAAAEPLLVQGYQGMKRHEDVVPPPFRQIRSRQALERIVHLYEAMDRQEQVSRWRKLLNELNTQKVPLSFSK
jgi:serine/threonine protein kinase/Tfp pilus assembly protein PilF